jgi:hypothetical protein
MEPEQILAGFAACARLIPAVALASAGAAWAAEAAPSLADMARTGDLVCELHSGSRAATGGRPDLLLVFDQVATSGLEARVVSSNKAGADTVKVYAGETGVHLVQDLTGSVVVTTLLNCEARERSAGRCVRYAAVHAWHFDPAVHRDPDTAFRRLPGTSYAGHCEAWHMEAPRRAQGR